MGQGLGEMMKLKVRLVCLWWKLRGSCENSRFEWEFEWENHQTIDAGSGNTPSCHVWWPWKIIVDAPHGTLLWLSFDFQGQWDNRYIYIYIYIVVQATDGYWQGRAGALKSKIVAVEWLLVLSDCAYKVFQVTSSELLVVPSFWELLATAKDMAWKELI